MALHRALDRFYVGFLEVFVYSSIWIAAGLASLALFTGHVLGLPWDLRPALLVFFTGLFIYNLDHVADARVEGIPDARAEVYFQRKSVLLLVVAAAIASGLMISVAPEPAKWVFGGYVSVGLLYGIPVIPLPGRDGLRWHRLKEIPGIKAWVVASAITIGVVGLPLGWSGVGLTLDAWFLGIFILVFCASNTHMFDVRDMDSDRAVGVRSLPLQAGVRGTKMALVLMNMAVLAIMMWGWIGGLTGPHPEVIVITALTVLYVLLVNERTPRDVYGILIDGCFFIPALLTLAHDGLRTIG